MPLVSDPASVRLCASKKGTRSKRICYCPKIRAVGWTVKCRADSGLAGLQMPSVMLLEHHTDVETRHARLRRPIMFNNITSIARWTWKDETRRI